MNATELKALAQQIAMLQGGNSPTTTTVSVGISQGLLSSKLERRSDKARGMSVLCHYRVISGVEMRFADKTLTPEQATKSLETLNSVAAEHGSVLELQAYLSFEIVEQLLDLFEENECSYAEVKFNLLENRIEAKKAKSLKEEGKYVPSLNLGQVTEVLDFNRANNPMGDSGELTTEEDLVFLIQQRAVESRAGFDTWKKGSVNNGKTETQPTSDQSVEDLA